MIERIAPLIYSRLDDTIGEVIEDDLAEVSDADGPLAITLACGQIASKAVSKLIDYYALPPDEADEIRRAVARRLIEEIV